MKQLLLSALAFITAHIYFAQNTNFLIIIADDLGVDVFNGYHSGTLMPTTPTLDSMRSEGITFENVWSAPSCTPTRASIMSAKYGVKTGVLKAPGNLDLVHQSLFTNLENYTNDAYEGAVVGKWHISQPVDYTHPSQHNVDHYNGVFQSAVPDYSNWTHTYQGIDVNDTNYVTSVLTDSASTWINNQTKPWVMWLAHVAPHSPNHVPPAHMHTLTATGTPFRKYLAMIESLDYEINRLFQSIDPAQLANTTIIFIGDNGGTDLFIQDYPSSHAKGTVYQGGIRVPMIVCGAGVTRQGEREPALLHVSDIHASIIEMAGQDLPGGLYNSLSFDHLLTGSAGATRDYVYSEIDDDSPNTAWAIRGERYKLIQFEDSLQEFYDLQDDSLEFFNLIDSLTPAQEIIRADLEAEGLQTRAAWSCRDHIQNGDEEDIDCGGTYCPACNTGINGINKNSLKVFPNPASELFYIQLEDASGVIELTNIEGRVIRRMPVKSTSMTIYTADLENGVYLINYSNDNIRTSKRIIVSKN